MHHLPHPSKGRKIVAASHVHLNAAYRGVLPWPQQSIFRSMLSFPFEGAEESSVNYLEKKPCKSPPPRNIFLIMFLGGAQALDLGPEAHFLSEMVFIRWTRTLVFYCKLVYKAELLDLIFFNEQKSDGILNWKEFTESCMQLAKSFKEKFSVVMKATRSKLDIQVKLFQRENWITEERKFDNLFC